MREFTCKPIEAMDIDKIELELNSRDDIPQLINFGRVNFPVVGTFRYYM